MTLDTYYLNYDRRSLACQVRIGGVDITEYVSISYSYALQKVPSATIRIRGALPPSVIFNAPVTIEQGFWGATQRVFTGTVLHPDNSDATGKTIECQGMSACLDNPYHKVIVTVDGSRTVPELIEDLLDAAGVLAYSVNMPDWTAGSVVPTTLSFQTYGEAITKLAEVNGGRWYETPTGVIKVEPKDPIPALSAWRTYFSMSLTGLTETYPTGIVSGRPRIRRCGQVRKAREVKNQVWVRGAVLTNVNPDGSESSVTLEERAYASSIWILNPDGSQAYNDELYSNEIIDLVAVAGAEAGRRVAVKNRLLTQVDVQIDGDPQVQVGLTVGIEDPSYSGVTGRWFVEGVTTNLSINQYQTMLTVLGGPESGSVIVVTPFANYVYSIEHEVMGDRPWEIVTFDGRPSIDPDGTIVSWCWTDNQSPMRISGCGEVKTVRVDPSGIVAPWEVTLTVTDNDGATDDLMLSIPYGTTGPDVWIPSIWAAFDVAASASPDGGVVWYDQAIAGKSVISTSAKPADGVSFGVGCFGTADGCIYRTTDYCLTAPVLVQAALGSPIEHVWWDINVTTRVWAVTRNGKVLWSWDDGLHWAVYDDLAVIFGLANIRLQRIGTPLAGGLWIFGGTGTGYPLICWDANIDHNWTGANLGTAATSELVADLTSGGGGGGGPVGWLEGTGEVFSYGGTWTRIHNEASSNYWRLKNLNGTLFRIKATDGAPWPGNLERSGDGGVTWTTVWTHVAAHSGINDIDRALDGTLYAAVTDAYISAGSVIKSTDDGLTWSAPIWSGSYGGVSIACHPTDSQQVAVLVYSGSFFIRVVYTTNGGASWTLSGSTGEGAGSGSIWANTILWGSSNRILFTTPADPQIHYSDNYCASWTGVANSPGGVFHYMRDFVRGATPSEMWFTHWVSDGEEYLAHTIDNGTSWDTSWARAVADLGFDFSQVMSLAYDPTTATLYWADRAVSGDAPEIYIMAYTVAGGWVNITANLNTAGSSGSPVFGICAPVAAGGDHPEIYVAHAAARSDGLAIILNSVAHAPAVYFSASGGLGDGSDWKRAIGDAGALAKTRGKWIDFDLTVGHYVAGFDDNACYRMDVAGGVGTLALAPAGLGTNKGNFCQSLAWYENIDQAYLLAAEDITGSAAGTIYKTWDRFETIAQVRPATGYTAAPAGAKAKMIAFGAPGSPAMASRIAVVHDTGGATTWDISYPDASFTSWITTALPATVTHERPRPKCLTSQLWFVENVGGFPDPTSKSALSECNRELSRSPDGGVTWGTTAIGDETCTSDRADSGDEINHFSRVAMDAGGRVWAARLRGSTTAHPIRSEIWYSDSQGANGTWVYSATLTYPSGGRFPRMLLCHPSNQNIIALISSSKYAPSGGDRGVIVYMTEDRGAHWTQRNATVASGSNFAMTDNGQACRYMMLPSGRLVIVNRYDTGSWFTIHTSDDKGATWQLRYTESGTPQEDNLLLLSQGSWKAGGDTLVGLRVPLQGGTITDFAVMTSDSAGNAWTVRTVPYPANHVGNNWDAVYDPIEDVIYAQDGAASAAAGRIWRLPQASTVGVTWQDVTDGLPYLNPTLLHWEGIALIPR